MQSKQRLHEIVRKAAITGPQSMASILDAVGNAKVVMIGEMTHGTQEFYHTRAEITKHLIEKKGFNFVAVEGDWPDVYRANRYVHGGRDSKDENAREALADFSRFPKWMWRNEVVADFVDWLRENNAGRAKEDMVGIYGLDLYSLFRSADEVINYLKKVDPEAAERARQRYGTLDRYRGHEGKYGVDIALRLTPVREKEVLAVLMDMLRKGPEYIKANGGFCDGDEYFYAVENSHVVVGAEKYYRNTMLGEESTWNLRDNHMYDTLTHLIKHYESKKEPGTPIKAVIWAHNSHLGDARASMYARTGEINLGQLVRERMGMKNCFNIGFTTSVGTVTAATRWGGDALKMTLNEPDNDTYEYIFRKTGLEEFTLILRRADGTKPNPELVKTLMEKRYERMIGVQYVKNTERLSHYIECCLPEQFDALIHIDRTSALRPLD